jgi:hypothetical protein
MRCVSFRNPRTTQERRENIAAMLDPEIVETTGRILIIRPKRVNLPTAWDDLQHSTKYRDNSWKRHRRTQYREV